MKFTFGAFSCDVDVFRRDTDVMARFYDKDKEHDDHQIVNYVRVDPGFGFLCLKFKSSWAGLLSGFLLEEVFSSDEMFYCAIDYVMSLSPLSDDAYIPYHVDRVRTTSHVEYNGEF
jgi:hypothetical protein